MRTIKILLNYCVVISCNIKLFQRNSGGVTFRGERLGPIEESWALKGLFGSCAFELVACTLVFSCLIGFSLQSTDNIPEIFLLQVHGLLSFVILWKTRLTR